MSSDSFLITVGGFAIAITAILALINASFRSMLRSNTRDQDIATAKREAEIAAEHKAIDTRLVGLHLVIQDGLNEIDGMVKKLSLADDVHRASIDDTVKRIIRLETLQENIASTLTRLETKLEGNSDTQAEIIRTLRAIADK